MRSHNLVKILGLSFALPTGSLACTSEPGHAHRAGHHSAPAVPEVRHRIAVAADDQALGGSEPLVTIVVFSDYACPPCGRAWQVFDHLLEDYGQDIRVVFRAITIPGFADGERAVEAALAAGAQGQFWPMHRRLYKGPSSRPSGPAEPPRFDRAALKSYAEELGLDVTRFLDDLDLGAFSAARVQHRREAVSLGIYFGPVSLVNGRPVIGFRDEASWHDLIDQEILAARAKIREGTPRAEVYAAFQAEAVAAPIDLEGEALAARKQLEQRFAVDVNKLPADFKKAEPGQRYQVPAGDAPASGPADAPVELVVFMDFECPFCRRLAQEGFAALRERHAKDVRLVFRQLPLPAHQGADGAARAAVAAGNQGQFWPFAERLLASDTRRLDRGSFIAAAQAVGLDEARFLADLDAPATARAVREDMLLARRLGASATPALFFNGRFVNGVADVEMLLAEVAAELKAADELVKAGTPRAGVAAALLARGLPPDQFPNPDSDKAAGPSKPDTARPAGPDPTITPNPGPSGPATTPAP